MLTVVMQGNITPWTEQFAKRYYEFPFVSEVILSTWEGEEIPEFCKHNLLILRNKKPDNPGHGNRNLQIVSSLAGLKAVLTPWAVKVRTDMFFPELTRMWFFARAQKLIHSNKIKAFPLSLYRNFAFHPRDHLFMGETKDVLSVFKIPLDPMPPQNNENYQVVCRSETYIGSFAYDDKIANKRNWRYEFYKEPKEYLTDNAHQKNKSFEIYFSKIREKKVFIPFPRVNIEWPKWYPNGYPFDMLEQVYGEMYFEKFCHF